MKTYSTYQLLLTLTEDITLTVGKLGNFTLVKGDYVYTGSAKKNFQPRVDRHLQKTKKLRWHIDYLTTPPKVTVRLLRKCRANECKLNQRTAGSIPIPGFGSSDCKAGCKAHLKKLRISNLQ